MKTPDFESYDDFKNITANTAGNTFVNTFRALMVVNSTAGGCTFSIQHLSGSPSALGETKTIWAHTGSNGGTVILAVSGDAVSVAGVIGGTQVYALR